MRYRPPTKLSLATVVLSIAFLGACGDSSTGPETPSYNDISGTYAGELAGTSQGVALDGTFSLTITQNDGSLEGSWSLSGTLTDGSQTTNVQGSGALNGSIESGDNPSVNLTVETGQCPSYSADFSGAYDTANSRLTISGPVEFLSNDCQVVLSYPSTIILTR